MGRQCIEVTPRFSNKGGMGSTWFDTGVSHSQPPHVAKMRNVAFFKFKLAQNNIGRQLVSDATLENLLFF